MSRVIVEASVDAPGVREDAELLGEQLEENDILVVDGVDVDHHELVITVNRGEIYFQGHISRVMIRGAQDGWFREFINRSLESVR